MQMHQSIKRFGMEGEVGDSADWPRLRSQFEAHVRREMREAGYAPILDLGPFWSTTYIADKDKFEFVLSIHGYKVGRRVACQIEGITGSGNLIPLSTPPNKSKPSSTPAE